jgi:hypothetical protein
MWREALIVMGDYEAKRVILVGPPDDASGFTSSEQYHDAIAERAEDLGARLGLWGYVEEGEDIWLTGFVDVTPRASGFRLLLEDPKTMSPGEPPQSDWIEIPVGKTQLDFLGMPTNSQDLFQRTVITITWTTVHTEPDPESVHVRGVKPETLLDAVDMDGSWFKVILEDGSIGYVPSSEVHVFPKLVQIGIRGAPLKKEPGKGHSITQLEPGGVYQVLDMRYRFDGGFWFQIKAGEHFGWVHSNLAHPQFSLPIIHFLAGLEHFSTGRYREADGYLQQYVTAPGAEGSPANLSTAHQLMGVARIMRQPVIRVKDTALEPFDEAVNLNPTDPAAYLARCLAGLGILRNPELALLELGKALDLDRENAGARALLLSMEDVMGLQIGTQTGLDQMGEEIQKLKEQYGVQ